MSEGPDCTRTERLRKGEPQPHLLFGESQLRLGRTAILPSYDPLLGMSNFQLEELCRVPRYSRKGLSPWVRWESENSSFGKCFREWAGFPKILPLFIVSPHGAYAGSNLSPNEIRPGTPTFFGWPNKKVKRRNDEYAMPSFAVQHPWVSYRKKCVGEPPPARESALFFFPHSNLNLNAQIEDEVALQEYLDKVEDICGQVTICLSFHDVAKGLHLRIREWGFPLVTAGHTSDQRFVDRFYSLIFRFGCTLSAEIGSEVFYCIEAGIPHSLTPIGMKYLGTGIGKPLGAELRWEDYGDSDDFRDLIAFRATLFDFEKTPTLGQAAFVRKALCVDAGISPQEARRILWREFMKNFWKLPMIMTLRLSGRFGFWPRRV